MIGELIKRLWPAETQNVSGTTHPDDWFVEAITYGESDTGLNVDGYTILRSGPIWQAVNTIAGDIGRLSLKVENADGTEARRHPAWRLLTREPNPHHLAITFKETLQSWALLWGNGCALIIRNQRGEPIQLIPLAPDRVTYVESGGSYYIVYRHVNGSEREIPYRDVLHIAGLGDSFWGYRVWDLAQNTAGHNLALQKHGNRQFKNSARPGGVLEKEGRMSNEGRTNLRREWNDIHQGLDNTARIALLQEGVKFKATQIANGDAQWIEARKFSREEVAAWFNLPPHKVGAMENASVRANLEEQNRDYWNSALSRWATKWEQECERKLFSRAQVEHSTHQVRFDLGDLIRADIGRRSEAYSQGRQWGWLSVNEIRQRENLPPIGPDGDTYLTPTNMTDNPSGAPAGDPEPSNATPRSDPPPASAEPTAVAERCWQLLQSRLDELLLIETDRLLISSEKSHPDTRLAKMYSQFATTLVDKLEPVVTLAAECGPVNPKWRDELRAYCDESLDKATAAVSLPIKIARVEQMRLIIDSWDDRRRELADKIRGVECHV